MDAGLQVLNSNLCTLDDEDNNDNIIEDIVVYTLLFLTICNKMYYIWCKFLSTFWTEKKQHK